MKKDTKIVEKAVEEAVQAAPVSEEKAAVEKKTAKTAAKTTEKKPAAKTTKTAAAKAPKKTAASTRKTAVKTKVVVELDSKSATSDVLIERAKEDWVKKGNALSDIKELAVYINASEGMVYYVVNDDYLSGSFVF